jgi:hypothetical protein
MTTYTSQYPPSQDATYVLATTKYSTSYWQYYATDPSKSLTGTQAGNGWTSGSLAVTNQRFHIDLGSSKIIRRIYYENGHEGGLGTNADVRAFILQGSDNAASFSETTYATDTGWANITTASSEFNQNTGSNTPEPNYILVTNSTAYRYYALKFATNWGYATYMWLRRIELQTEDGYAPGITFIPRVICF